MTFTIKAMLRLSRNMLSGAALALLAVVFSVSQAAAQKAEITLRLDEAFFDALLDATFKNFDPPEFSIASDISSPKNIADMHSSFLKRPTKDCSEKIRILRGLGDVKTAVRFRNGHITVPLAFSGDYAPPFVGCVEFSGWADSDLVLDFDRATNALVGRIQVTNVNLNGTGGIGGTFIAKLIQGSIDKKINPVRIIGLDKVAFDVPIQNVGSLHLKPTSIRPEVVNDGLEIHIEYEFQKG